MESIKTENVKFDIAGKAGVPIDIQIGPTPGYAFAVYSQNKAYHGTTRDDWFKCAQAAIEFWAAKGNKQILRTYPEPGRPFNLALEYA